jgi:hypothetical protein
MILPAAGTDLDGVALTNILASLLGDTTKSVYATVATTETRSNNTFGNLATTGPTVSITSQGSLAWVWWGCLAWGSAANASGRMAIDISGGTTMAAATANGFYSNENAGSGIGSSGGTFARYPINPGVSNTYTAKYNNIAANGTASFQLRWMLVVAP